MVYGRWTIFYFDASKKDAMLSHLTSQLDKMAKEVTGAVQGRLVQVAENRMVVHATYENKEAADAAAERASGVRASMAEFVTEAPIIREGELVWGVDPEGQAPGSPTPTASYMTFRATDIDSSKYDSLMAYMDSKKEQFRGISGLLRLRIARIAENRLVAATIYDDKASSDAAQENAAAVMVGGSEFFTGNVVFLQGDLMWSGRPNS
tara:strand:+ start:151 stop:771 length:621 start_codon:yes stop_codon:yes gene_type:complete